VARFGPDPQDLAHALSFLRDTGLKIATIYSGGQLITIKGTMRQAEQAFHVQVHEYRAPAGYTFYQPDQAPQVPTSLAGVITAVSGFDTSARPNPGQLLPHIPRNTADATSLSSGPVSNSGGYTPYQLRTAYDLDPLISGGQTGTNRTIDLLEFDSFASTDPSTFDSYYSLTPPAPVVMPVNGGVATPGSAEGEVELDIEVLQGMAPNVGINVYEAPAPDLSSFFSNFALEAQAIASARDASVASSSWDWCEIDWDSGSLNQVDAAFQQMTLEGIDTFMASGDDGSASDCTNEGGYFYEVEYPASDPNVTAVGGTSLNTNSDGSYASEAVWNDSALYAGTGHLGAGGGGLSGVFSIPSYQHGPGVSDSYSNGYREVPDVAALASPDTGSPTAGYDVFLQGSWTQEGGTSAATPLWAAVVELCNEYAIQQGLSGNGFVNPTLYNLAAGTPGFAPLHDVTTGDNDPAPAFGDPKHNPIFYPATSGYDLASGLGSPDAYNLARDLAGVAPAPTGTATSTAVPPTTTGTSTPTDTPAPPTSTLTSTPVPPTSTATSTLVSPTSTSTNTATAATTGTDTATNTPTTATASPTATETATPTPVQTSTVPLAAGWNLITLPLSPTTPLDAHTVLASLISMTHGRYTELDSYTNGQVAPSLYDDPGDNLGIGGADFTLQPGQGYALYTDTAGSITVAGTPITTAMPFTLATGWNLVGFPDAGTTTYMAYDVLTTLLAATHGSYAEIDSYSNGQFSPSAFDDPGDHLGLGGTNFTLQSGQGYALYTDAGTTLSL
jgi:kumamolisin